MPTVPTKEEKRKTLLSNLPVNQSMDLHSLLLHFDVIRQQARKAGIEHSFIVGVQIDVNGYGSIKDTYESPAVAG